MKAFLFVYLIALFAFLPFFVSVMSFIQCSVFGVFVVSVVAFTITEAIE